MNHNWLTYKQIFATFLVIVYIIGNFSLPIFESVHFLLHLGDKSTPHSLLSHSSMDHNHKVLNVLNDLCDNDPDQVPSNNTNKKNKLPLNQYMAQFTLYELADKLPKKVGFIEKSSFYSTPYISLATPPPIAS